ncbi:MAG: hypothetical protein ONA90_11630, partial [candidate division KSB1 bacterium]|nr:hypothetical protein [candidate division KSB1 bacterium]
MTINLNLMREIVVAANCIATMNVFSADISWVNPQGGTWSNPGNWNPRVVPGASDNVFITLNVTVTLDVNATVAGLALGGAGVFPTLSLSGNTLTNLGTFQWVSGSIVGPGTIANNRSLNILSGAVPVFANSAILNNAGTLTFGRSADFRAGTGAVINNLAGATLALQDGALSSGSGVGGVATLVNAGRVLKADSTGTATWGVAFNNTNGLIEVQTGTLRFTGGGASTGGTFNVSNGALLDFSVFANVLSGRYTGTTAGNVTPNFRIDTSGVEFDFPAPGLNWFGGVIGGPGPGALTNRGHLNILRGAVPVFANSAILNNAGTLTFGRSADFRAGTGAVINNLAGATL